MARKLAEETRTFQGVEYLAMLDVQMGQKPTATSKVVQVIPTDPAHPRDRNRMLATWIGKTYNSWRDPKCQFL